MKQKNELGKTNVTNRPSGNPNRIYLNLFFKFAKLFSSFWEDL